MMQRKGVRLDKACVRLFMPMVVLALLSTMLVQVSMVAAQENVPTNRYEAIVQPTNAMTMTVLGRYDSGIEGESASEIVAYDSQSQRLFVTNGFSSTIDVLDASDPTTPVLTSQIVISPTYGKGANSVAVANGVLAAAVENMDSVSAGRVVFFDTDGQHLSTVQAGVLPDMLTFTPDGQKVLVANEAEPDDSDPEGSVTIVNLSAGAANVTQSDVMSVTFSGLNGQENALRARGVRVFPDKTVAEDMEPEYLSVSPDGSTAFVTLQENNAFAVINIESAELVDILPLGLKDHRRGPAALDTFEFPQLPVLGTTEGGQDILLGGLSGLWFEGMDNDGNYQFVTVPDRGPNGAPTDVDNDGKNERPFALPDYQARIVRFTLNSSSGQITLGDTILLKRADGTTPITGLPNIAGADEEPVDLSGNLLSYDAFGADLEGIVVASDGTFWMVDEYRPSIYHFDASGVLIERLVPEGTGTLAGQPAGTYGTESLPAEYINRRANRGFEAIALDTDNNILYAFIQTPLMNPDRATSDASRVIRMLGINPQNGTVVSEYAYLLEAPTHRASKVDKVSGAVYAGDGKFYVIERDSATSADGKKYIYEMNLKGATNLQTTSLSGNQTLEQLTADQLAAQNIQWVDKIKVLNLPSLGYLAGDKPEGLALLNDGRLAVLNDNDFALLNDPIPGDGTVGLDPNPTPITLGIINFAEGNALDASNLDGLTRSFDQISYRDNPSGTINIQNWPVYGMYQPDSIASFAVNGQTYYATANEGDARDEDMRAYTLTLDANAFPNAATLQTDGQIGRLNISTINGDIDHDGDYDQLWAYGGRSFTIWDQYGNLVFDSSDDFERITAQQVPEIFNSNGMTDTFDTRSDDKGPEPEALTIGEIDGKTYAFIGLERIGGIMVYDVTIPSQSTFVTYVREPMADQGPEGLQFVSSSDSPTGKPLLIVASEESGSTTLYELNVGESDPTAINLAELGIKQATGYGYGWPIALGMLMMTLGLMLITRRR